MKKLSLYLICLLLTAPCMAKTITVDDDGPADFNTIQAAIDDANEEDTVLVSDGNEAETRKRVERVFEKVMGYDAFVHLSRVKSYQGSKGRLSMWTLPSNSNLALMLSLLLWLN